MSRHTRQGILCPHNCDYMFVIGMEHMSKTRIKVRYKCEYCGCIKEITYNIKPVSEDWWD